MHGDSAKTVLKHDKINVWELYLPPAQILLQLIMLVIVLLSYLRTRDTQFSKRDVVINVDNNEAWL